MLCVTAALALRGQSNEGSRVVAEQLLFVSPLPPMKAATA